MVQEAKFRVRLDTAQAKKDLDDLTAAAGGVSIVPGGQGGPGTAPSLLGRMMSSLGMGAGLAAGWSMFSAASTSGVGAIAEDALGGFGRMLDREIAGDLGPEANAMRRAREQAKEVFGYQAFMEGKLPDDAVAYRDAILPHLKMQEVGRQIIGSSPEFHVAGEITKAVEDAAKKIDENVRKGFDDLLEAVRSWRPF